MTPELLESVRDPMPVVGEMDHVTPWPERSLLTKAVMGRVSPACTVAVAGVAVTLTAGTVMVTELAAEASATEVAVTVTVRSLAGAAVGAR